MQLSQYLDDEKGVIFENPHTIPLDGTFNSIEDFLPVAAIAGLYPNHFSIRKGLDFMLAHKNKEDIILNGHITTEGCYTLAYPLAALATIRKDEELAKLALTQLTGRAGFLADSSATASAIYQRSDLEGNKGYKNWGRGVAWYLLGTIKTLRLLHQSGYGSPDDIKKMEASFMHHVSWIAKLQDRQGMWYAYLDRPETNVDTSTTGGIAAAIAWGCHDELLDKNKYMPTARKAYQALQTHLSADGFLRDITQINRGGEALQASGYRVISQFGMGLMAQLQAALKSK